jgi:hypothetical protein
MEKRNLVIYWLATALMSVGMLGSGISQVLQAKEMVEILTHLGYPVYFMMIIGVWKVLGVMVILLPGLKLVKEWAYAGLFFVMTGALISHLAVGDDGKAIIAPLMQSIFIILSWYFRPTNRKVNLANL